MAKTESRGGALHDPETVRGWDPEGKLEELAKISSLGVRYVLPGSLCAPVFHLTERSGRAQRLISTMLWMSSPSLRAGARVMFRVPERDIHLGTGFDRLKEAGVLDSVMEITQQEVVTMERGNIPVFEHLELSGETGRRTVDWVFSSGFSDLFVEPASFARLDIRHNAALHCPIDHLVYRQVMLVWNRRLRQARVDLDDVRRVFGIHSERGIKRSMERLRRSADRVGRICGARIQVERPSKEIPMAGQEIALLRVDPEKADTQEISCRDDGS